MRLTLNRLSLGGVPVEFARAWIDVETNGFMRSWSGRVLGSDARGTLLDSSGWDLSAETADGRIAEGASSGYQLRLPVGCSPAQRYRPPAP